MHFSSWLIRRKVFIKKIVLIGVIYWILSISLFSSLLLCYNENEFMKYHRRFCVIFVKRDKYIKKKEGMLCHLLRMLRQKLRRI